MLKQPLSHNAHDRIGAALRDNKALIIAEIGLIGLIFTLFKAVDVLQFTELPLLVLGTVSLWVRRVGWRGVGLGRPASWSRTLLISIAAGAACTLFIDVLGDPLFARITGQPIDNSSYGDFEGNLTNVLIFLGVSWTLAAFGEELVYRGYWMNRVADLFNGSRVGWVVAALVVCTIFGIAHFVQGLNGMISSTLAGLAYAVMYFATGRNLWAAIITHGMSNTFTLLLLYWAGIRVGSAGWPAVGLRAQTERTFRVDRIAVVRAQGLPIARDRAVETLQRFNAPAF